MDECFLPAKASFRFFGGTIREQHDTTVTKMRVYSHVSCHLTCVQPSTHFCKQRFLDVNVTRICI